MVMDKRAPSQAVDRVPTAFNQVPLLDYTMDHADIMVPPLSHTPCLLSNLTRYLLPFSLVLGWMRYAHWSVVKCVWGTETILIRTYGKGTDALIDRNQEMMNFVILSRSGLSPKVHGRFHNGFIYGYVDLKHDEKYPLIARHMARWHKVDASDIIEPTSHLFKTYYEWLDLIPEKFTNPSVDATAAERGGIFFFTASVLENLEAELSKVDSPVVFCHGDVNPMNIIYDAESGKIDFIDYEYGFYRPRGFDLGNHFCEHTGFDCEWELYPNPEFQRKFLREYLEACDTSKPVTEEDVSRACAEANKFSLASNLGWGIWGLVQAELSDLEFDYPGYSKMRFDEYFRRKKAYLAM
ncbi:choline/ethanolamine kinase [Chytriomyces cf. hyalinus JEL632]|nr:choline/ethanolamine kinase [Chytriomyces cf. hyalinus JEL632]